MLLLSFTNYFQLREKTVKTETQDQLVHLDLVVMQEKMELLVPKAHLVLQVLMVNVVLPALLELAVSRLVILLSINSNTVNAPHHEVFSHFRDFLVLLVLLVILAKMANPVFKDLPAFLVLVDLAVSVVSLASVDLLALPVDLVSVVLSV